MSPFFSSFLLPLSSFTLPPPPPPALSLSLSLQVHNEYTADDFVGDLRTVLRRTSCFDEKIVFIMDESNVLDFALERMNTLLANGEVRREREWRRRKESECIKNDYNNNNYYYYYAYLLFER